MTNQNQKYIDDLEKHVGSTKENKRHSIDRFDILIISLSSGALGLSLSTIKDLINNFPGLNLSCLKFSWILFAIAIVLNLLSQKTAFIANDNEIRATNNLIRKEKGKEMKGDQEGIEKMKSKYNTLTIVFNNLSLYSLMLGIVLLLIFILINF